MEAMLRRLAIEALSRAIADGTTLEAFVQRELPRELLERKLASGAKLPSEIREHYQRLLAGPPEGVVVEPALDLHKAWHGIHFLLTGAREGGTPPLAYAVLGFDEQTLGDDLGDGPATYLTPEQVRDVSRALAALSIDELRRRYDPVRMTALDIYPVLLWQRGSESFDWLMQFYEPLPAYYAAAARDGRAMLIWKS